MDEEEKGESSEADKPSSGKKRILSSDEDEDDLDDFIEDIDDKAEGEEKPSTSQETPKKKSRKLLSS